MRWIGDGVLENKNYSIFCSCDCGKHIFGIGFVISRRIKYLILDFRPKSSRLCRIGRKGMFDNYSVICAHFPTEEKKNRVKDFFCSDWDIYNKFPLRDIKFVLDDCNSKIGREDEFRMNFHHWKP
ncbi:uncharacterized protein CDAR_228351 [Caerostris darwini]|uniref:Uncharacterized protein n=1 Tax=Caerostris darwini TaxID=1538125 RepID=A0AAV4N5N2_9ARAC|nr:uncharacterized protein CDAR_228351 [Caerostris darwini]